jgi:hypothetical protein
MAKGSLTSPQEAIRQGGLATGLPFLSFISCCPGFRLNRPVSLEPRFASSFGFVLPRLTAIDKIILLCAGSFCFSRKHEQHKQRQYGLHGTTSILCTPSTRFNLNTAACLIMSEHPENVFENFIPQRVKIPKF